MQKYQLEQKKIKNEAKVEPEEAEEQKSAPPQPGLPVVPTIELLEQELIARAARAKEEGKPLLSDPGGTPQRDELFKYMEHGFLHSSLNEALKYFSGYEIALKLRQMIEDVKPRHRKDGDYTDERLEIFDISNERVLANTRSVVMVCFESDLVPGGSDFFELRTKTYGAIFNLGKTELFYSQPIAAGAVATGLLVGDDLVLTAAHLVHGANLLL